MSILDSILGQVSGNVDIANLATKLGIDPGMAEKAVAALGKAHVAPGDTVQTAAAQTGLDAGILTQMVEHLGGEGSLTAINQALSSHPQAASIFASLDRDGDGNPLNDIAGMAKGLFGKD